MRSAGEHGEHPDAVPSSDDGGVWCDVAYHAVYGLAQHDINGRHEPLWNYQRSTLTMDR